MSGNSDAGSADTLRTAETLPEGTPAKTFKACRLCRKMKMRCEGNDSPPCKRCSSSGHECVFDHVESVRKRKRDEEKVLREEVQKLKRRIASLTDIPHSSTPSGHTMECDTPTSPVKETGREFEDPDDLSPEQLSAPVTAVHEMAPDCTSHDPEHAGSMKSGKFDISLLNKSLRGPENPANDILSRHSIDEQQAHALFNMYMAGSNPYLPLFEPILDTFERIRTSSAFLLVSILSVSSRNNSNMQRQSKGFQEEAHRLAAASLFESAVQLETVQAMLILAAWSEKSWFAFGHAINMALDLGIDKAFSTLTKHSSSDENSPRLLARQARTWLILYHLEREIAFGTARKSRFAYIDKAQLRSFLGHPSFRHLDLRFMSIIELVQLREKWQSSVEKSTDLIKNATRLLQRAEDEFFAWKSFWIQQHKDHGYDNLSFQTTSLTVQLNYAIILVCCGILSKLQRQKANNQDTETTVAAFKQFSNQTLMAVINHLKFIADKKAFTWHLQFAPTYSALTIAFSALGITLSKAHPAPSRQSSLISTTRAISSLLAEYPNQKFHLLVESFMHRLPKSTSQMPPAGTGPALDLTREPQNYDMSLSELFTSTNSNSQFDSRSRNDGAELHDAQFANTLVVQDRELEAILGLPADSWLSDSFSADVFSWEGA